jgi:hypothetical protein
MPVIRRPATEVTLPGPHTEHLTILKCAKHCFVRGHFDDGHGGYEAPMAMHDMGGELLDLWEPHGVLYVDSRPNRVRVNPRHFDALPTDGMTTFEAAFYEASLHTLRYQLEYLVWPHGSPS